MIVKPAPRPHPPFNADGITQLGASAAAKTVADIPTLELWPLDFSTLISRLRLQVPHMLLAQSDRRFEDCDGLQTATIVVPLDDPSGMAQFIYGPAVSEEIYFQTDAARSVVQATGFFFGWPLDAAYAAMDNALSEFQLNIDCAAHYVERYNAALPYLIWHYARLRADGDLDLSCFDDEEVDVAQAAEEN